MGNRLRRAVAACLLSGLLIALAYFFQAVGADVVVGNLGIRQASAAEPAAAGTSKADAPAKARKSAAEASQQDSSDDGGEEDESLERMSINLACYVCHMTFIHEELSTVHLKEKVTCIDCHGVSGPHANDEDIGATKPDKFYTRPQINAACRKCHEDHIADPEKIVAQWIELGSPKQNPVCTDCHGTHKIEPPQLEEPEKDDDATDPSDGKTKK